MALRITRGLVRDLSVGAVYNRVTGWLMNEQPLSLASA